MKKIGLLLSALALALALTACGGTADTPPDPPSLPAESQSGSHSGSHSDERVGEAIAPEGLGFTANLPALLSGHTEVEIFREAVSDSAQGDEITTVMVYYTTGTDRVFVLSFEEMSAAAWEERRTQPGSVGTELGRSDAGRVVALNVLQSNPFAEGEPEYALFDELRGQMGVIRDTFAFAK